MSNAGRRVANLCEYHYFFLHGFSGQRRASIVPILVFTRAGGLCKPLKELRMGSRL